MALITDLPAASSIAGTDVLVKDTGSATQKITWSDMNQVKDITAQCTYNTTKLTTPDTFTVKRAGQVVQVYIGNFNAVTTGDNQTSVITGLPTAATQISAFPGGSGAAQNAAVGNAGNAFWIGAGANGMNAHIGTKAYPMWLAFSYITSDPI